MWKPLLGFGVFSAALAVALIGSPIFGEAVMKWAADLEAFLWGSFYSGWIVMPSLFLILFGFGIGFYLVPSLIRQGRQVRHKKDED